MGVGAEGVQLAEGTYVWVQHRGEWCSAEVEATSASSSVHLALHDRGESLREVPRSSVLLQEPASNAQAPVRSHRIPSGSLAGHFLPA